MKDTYLEFKLSDGVGLFHSQFAFPTRPITNVPQLGGEGKGGHRGLIPPPASPHMIRTQWRPPKREPAKAKAELREMFTEAVRNTAQPEPKRPPKAQRDFAASIKS